MKVKASKSDQLLCRILKVLSLQISSFHPLTLMKHNPCNPDESNFDLELGVFIIHLLCI